MRGHLAPSLGAAGTSIVGKTCLEVLGARDRDDLARKVVEFAERLGFDTVSATLMIDRPGEKSHFIGIDNTPPAYWRTSSPRRTTSQPVP